MLHSEALHLKQEEIQSKSFHFLLFHGQIKSAETFISEKSSANSPSPVSGNFFTCFLLTLLALEETHEVVDIGIEFLITGLEFSGRSSSDKRRTREAMDEIEVKFAEAAMSSWNKFGAMGRG
ncbi:hypothetical protein MRB53_009459 [Persea americana]|uniref:Uncharacterized protein n=1 Tax=Persea americana TaxID=3435 RepID=A0ACC2LQ55_PERAE|nr:hypothetical protein MRB53_009459 [Persea americana]